MKYTYSGSEPTDQGLGMVKIKNDIGNDVILLTGDNFETKKFLKNAVSLLNSIYEKDDFMKDFIELSKILQEIKNSTNVIPNIVIDSLPIKDDKFEKASEFLNDRSKTWNEFKKSDEHLSYHNEKFIGLWNAQDALKILKGE